MIVIFGGKAGLVRVNTSRPNLKELPVQKVLSACVAFSLFASCALAADPRIDSAIQEFKAVASNPARLKTYCAMSNAVDTAEEKDNTVAKAAIDRHMKELGAEFEKAWHVGDDVDENSPDGKALSAAVDELTGQCD